MKVVGLDEEISAMEGRHIPELVGFSFRFSINLKFNSFEIKNERQWSPKELACQYVDNMQ